MADLKKLVALETPPAEEVLDFLRRTVVKLEQAGQEPVAAVVTILHRGNEYSVHSLGTRESGTLAMIGVLDAAKSQLLRHLERR